MRRYHLPPFLLFMILGTISTIWFLIRVIPKPSRAAYPCMQFAAPFMSGFVVYLLSLGGITLALRKARQRIANSRYLAGGAFMLVAITGFVLSITNGVQFSFAGPLAASGPDDGPNTPIGKALGNNPGRVVWVWNPEATNENCVSNFETKNWYWKAENINEKVVGDMFRNSLNKLTGKSSVKDSWDLLFQYHNSKKYGRNSGYVNGEKIFVKVNQEQPDGC